MMMRTVCIFCGVVLLLIKGMLMLFYFNAYLYNCQRIYIYLFAGTLARFDYVWQTLIIQFKLKLCFSFELRERN